jgi:predicted DNA-binding transcriptional regulator YafY
MSGRNSQISRIYNILDLLDAAPQGLTVNEIASRINQRGHQASKRTVYRDLEALNAAGFPLMPEEEATDEGAARWVLEHHTKISKYLVLSSRELIALYLARGVLEPLRDTPFFLDLESAFSKIEEKLGSKSKDFFQDLANELQFEPGPRWGLGLDPDTLETVRSCCAESQILEVMYASANGGDKRVRRLGPHYLYFSKGSIYLLAEDMADQKIKVFGLPRMTDAKMLDETYAGEPVAPEEFFKSSFGIFKGGQPVEVKIEFNSTVSPFVKERRWHASQRVVTKSDGCISLSFDVAITPELVQWVLGFGPNAKILEPVELRNQVIESAKKMLDVYKIKKAA